MSHHPLAGKHVPPELLPDLPNLVSLYYLEKPDPQNPEEGVKFGTSGHRGSSLKRTFTESHILAIVQAICDYRRGAGISGHLFLGKDTHALSDSAFKTAVEVLAANEVEVFIDQDGGFTPTPVISNAILTYNRDRRSKFADGIVITPSHNPPEDGGIKYNPINGGPADIEITSGIAERANELIKSGLRGVKRLPYTPAKKAACIHRYDYISGYVNDLSNVVDLAVVRNAGVKIGADALGGAGLAYWSRIAERYGLNIDILNNHYDPTFRFMRLDYDGKIRMDCSSRFAMAGLIHLRDKYDIAFGNDPDFDRHGIVTPGAGLMNPNHFLAVAVWYLFQHRREWSPTAAVGKTLVSSSMIDRVARSRGREVREVPVGFKWFVEGLQNGSLGFGGEESAGASFLRKNGKSWTTDKDGIIMSLLAAEILAVTGKDPGQHYQSLTEQFGETVYRRKDVDAEPQQLEKLKKLAPENVSAEELAGETILQKITKAPANNEPIDGLKVTTQNGWFAARPSGTEPKYKIYAESFLGKVHLEKILGEAEAIVAQALHT
jgi:phosphoglucomutase